MDVLVSYAFYDKGTARCQENLQFFLKEGVKRFEAHENVRVELSVNGTTRLELPPTTKMFEVFTRENAGFDFGAHADALDRALKRHGTTRFAELPYKAYVFLNGSQRGPFLPEYWPRERHWSAVFTDKMEGDCALVGSCMFHHIKTHLPTVETWAFAVRPDGLQALVDEGSVFRQHTTKHSACVAEDTLTKTIVDRGLKFATLQIKFARNPDQTNDYKIASRPWAYEGISIHPLETVFFKTYWDTASADENFYECPFEQRYTQWIMGEPEHKRDVLPIAKDWRALRMPAEKPAASKKHRNVAVIVPSVVAATLLAGLLVFLFFRK